MIGADEITISDKHHNVVFVRRGAFAKEAIAEVLEKYAAKGFAVSGNQIMATKHEIERAW